MGQDRLEDVRIVGDAELVGHGQEESVGFGNGFIRPELLDEYVRVGRVAAAEDRARVAFVT